MVTGGGVAGYDVAVCVVVTTCMTVVVLKRLISTCPELSVPSPTPWRLALPWTDLKRAILVLTRSELWLLETVLLRRLLESLATGSLRRLVEWMSRLLWLMLLLLLWL